jgi:2-polyprenyl-3-methyl-5-hydroxy-6-metoxy-1,4-benzoquinol methylase
VNTENEQSTEDIVEAFNSVDAAGRERVYLRVYEERYQRKLNHTRIPSARRLKRIDTYCRAMGAGNNSILETGCGIGDLTYALSRATRMVVGSDVSANAVSRAKERHKVWAPGANRKDRVVFLQMNATDLAFPGAVFDVVISTSMIEHLHPEDVPLHLREVWRVLKPNGKYLVWCPNALGHHNDRDIHLSMFSYSQLMDEMGRAGFGNFRSCLFNKCVIGIDAKWKVFLEKFLTFCRINILWSHLGVRNILLMATKQVR